MALRVSLSVSPLRYAEPRYQHGHCSLSVLLIGVNHLNAVIATVLGSGIQAWWMDPVALPWGPSQKDSLLLHSIPCEKGMDLTTQKALPPSTEPHLRKDGRLKLAGFTHVPRISPIIRLTVTITFSGIITTDLHRSQ